MKKIFTVFLLSSLALLGCPKAGADVVSLEKATAAARQYFNDGAVTRAGAIEPVLAWTYNEVTKGPYAPAFYVFNNPQGGWMIISGEDACHAILAHSDTGSFDPQTLPENTAWWLDGYAEQIEWARMNYIKQDAQTAAEWNDLLKGNIRKSSNQVELGTPEWNQREPFNLNCPYYLYGGDYYNCPCGCVATALAEVMYYHAVTRNLRLPEKGHGTVGGYKAGKVIYDSNQDTISTHETLTLDSEGNYDWENIQFSYPSKSSGTPLQRAAVAKLIYHCGLMSEMDWGQSGSGAGESNAAMALVKNMGYNPGLYLAYRSAYTESEWINLLKSEIDAERPLIMGGHNSTGGGGHEFVADGYNEYDELRMNWGWSNSANGWYAATAFTPPSDHDYRYGVNAIIGAEPVTNTNYTPNDSIFLRVGTLKMTSDISVSSDGKYLVAINVTNSGAKAFSGDLRLFLYDYKDTRICVSSTNKITPSSPITPRNSKGWSDWTGNYRNIDYQPALGDKLMLCYSTTDLAGSKPIFAKTSYGSCNNNIPVYDIPFIRVKDGGDYQVGEFFDFIITNSRTVPKDMTIEWFFDGNPITHDAATRQASRRLDTAGTHTIKAVVTIGDITETLVQVITVQ